MRVVAVSAFLLSVASLGACAPKHTAPPSPPVETSPAPPPATQAQVAELDAALTDVTTKLVDTQAQLDAVLNQLAKLEGMVEKVASPEPTRPTPRAGRPDPAAIYRVEIGDAHTRGKATALVTLVEWTDYQ